MGSQLHFPDYLPHPEMARKSLLIVSNFFVEPSPGFTPNQKNPKVLPLTSKASFEFNIQMHVLCILRVSFVAWAPQPLRAEASLVL